jgi:hypothetical protein
MIQDINMGKLLNTLSPEAVLLTGTVEIIPHKLNNPVSKKPTCRLAMPMKGIKFGARYCCCELYIEDM